MQIRAELSDRAKDFVRQNHNRMSIHMMANCQNVSWETVKMFLDDEGLEARVGRRGKGAKANNYYKKVREIVPEGLFDVHQFQNWLVGAV